MRSSLALTIALQLSQFTRPMNVRISLSLAFSVFLFANTCSTRAQGTAFRYQGRLNDAAGPANGSYDLRFALFDASTGGNQAGDSLTNAPTAVNNGLFSVILDFGQNFSGADRWLEIGVRTNGGGSFATLTPRQSILPAPYAIYASQAGNASFAASAATAATANAVGAVQGSNVAQLNVPNTTAQATGTVVVTSGFITGVNLLNGGFGYGAVPLVTVNDATGSNAVITPTVANGTVVTLAIQNAGNNYSSNAKLLIAPPPSNAYQTFNSGNIFNGANTFSNASNSFVGSFNGSFGSLSGGTVTLTKNLILPPAATNAGIIYSGSSTLIHTFVAPPAQQKNFFAGTRAGNLTMTGNQNVGVGFEAMLSNTSGGDNTASGFWALRGNTGGSFNTANGNQSLRDNTTGNNNTATGWGTLMSNTTGGNNTADGMQALRFNTTGAGNTAIGFDALLENTTGSRNTANGSVTLWNNTTGNDNTANGYNVLANNTTGSQNTGIGSGVLQNNIIGARNSAYGYQALSSNTNGVENTASGASSLHSNTSGSQNAAHGYYALYSNVTGGGNTANGAYSLFGNSAGSANTANGDAALNINNGNNNTADGYEALKYSTTGSSNIALGFQAGINLTNGSSNIEIGHPGVPGDNNTIRIGTPGVHTSTFIAGVISGNGAALSTLNASQLSAGTIADGRLSPNVPLLGADQVFEGANAFNNPANSFKGDGAGLVNLSANAIQGGLTINIAILVPGGRTNILVFANGILKAIQ